MIQEPFPNFPDVTITVIEVTEKHVVLDMCPYTGDPDEGHVRISLLRSKEWSKNAAIVGGYVMRQCGWIRQGW